MDTCRDSHGIHNVTVFNVWASALCYVYFFPNGDLRFNFNGSNPGPITLDNIRKGNIKIEVRILYEHFILDHGLCFVYILKKSSAHAQ